MSPRVATATRPGIGAWIGGVTALVVAVVWLGVQRVNGTQPNLDGKRGNIVLIAEWNPTPRAVESDVRLWVVVNGRRVEDVAWRTSPWRHVLDVTPPVVVRLTVTQDTDGLIRCTILRGVGGTVVAKDHRWGPGAVRCDAVISR